MFDWEHGIALHPMQGNRASSRGEGEVSLVFTSCGINLGCILESRRVWPLKLQFVQRHHDSRLVMTDTSGN